MEPSQDRGHAAWSTRGGFRREPIGARGSPWVNAKVTIFFGDVFVYLKTRNEANGGPIVGEVLDAFRRAEKARNATAPSRTQSLKTCIGTQLFMSKNAM
jgi:hypothetical protein